METNPAVPGVTAAVQAHTYSPEQHQILEALSSDVRWRSRGRILEITGLAPRTLDKSLAELVHNDVVRPVFGKREIVFGLRERFER